MQIVRKTVMRRPGNGDEEVRKEVDKHRKREEKKAEERKKDASTEQERLREDAESKESDLAMDVAKANKRSTDIAVFSSKPAKTVTGDNPKAILTRTTRARRRR